MTSKNSKVYIAIYPISANPPTYGHADIMVRAAKKFEQLFWVAAVDPDKTTVIPTSTKLEMMEDYVQYHNLTNVKVEYWDGSIVRYAQKKGAQFILRGIRNTKDLSVEMELATGYRGVSAEIETLCLFPNPELVMVSSTMIRQLARVGEQIDQYLLPTVAKKFEACLKGRFAP